MSCEFDCGMEGYSVFYYLENARFSMPLNPYLKQGGLINYANTYDYIILYAVYNNDYICLCRSCWRGDHTSVARSGGFFFNMVYKINKETATNECLTFP